MEGLCGNCQVFLGNRKTVNYKGIVAKLLSILQDTGANMSIKLHFLYSHLHRFTENRGDLSDKQGERFHQPISEMEVRHQGRWNGAMLADCCWSIKRDDAFAIHSRRSLKQKFMAEQQTISTDDNLLTHCALLRTIPL